MRYQAALRPEVRQQSSVQLEFGAHGLRRVVSGVGTSGKLDPSADGKCALSDKLQMKAELLGPEFQRDPYPSYARLRRDDRVSKVQLRNGLTCWVILRYDDAVTALADPRLSRDPRMAAAEWKEADRGRPLEDGSNLGIHLLTRDPQDHTRLRGLIAATFAPRRVEAMSGRVQQIADSLIDSMQTKSSADLIADFAYPLAITVICELLGIPKTDHHLFRQWTSNAVTKPASSPGQYLRALVETKRRFPADDLVSELIAAREQNRMSEDELLSMIFLLLIAGHEGTVALIGNSTLALLSSPDQLALLRSRPDLLDSAVEEILRHDGPMELAAWRFATEPLTLGDTKINKGDPVVIALAAAHRDPDQFPDPDRFDIARIPNPHLGFGHGIHYCTGARLARIEGRIALATLFTRIPDLTLATPPEDLLRQPSFVVRGLHRLPVTYTRPT